MFDTTKIPDSQNVTARVAALIEGHDVSKSRQESLTIAATAGADDATLVRIRDAIRVGRDSRTVLLPPGRYEHCSRGKGWARQGKGSSAVWGEDTGSGYRVGAGRWVVGSSDGFSRKSQVDWLATHITVGDQVWTIAE